MNKTLLKNLSFFIGGITLLATGLMYVLITDLYLSNTSVYLLLGIVLALAGSICFIVADTFKEKLKIFYLLKGIGIFMSIAFIVFLFLYMKTDLFAQRTFLKLFKTYNGKTIWFLSKNFQGTNGSVAIECNIVPLYIINIVIAITAVVIQSVNLLLNMLFGVEE